MTEEVKLPRPLQDEEFYCHKCKKFFPMTEHSEHNKWHFERER